MSDLHDQIRLLSDGNRSLQLIADTIGISRKKVRKIVKELGLPKRSVGAGIGHLNHQFAGGRRIDLSGYVLVTAPENHPSARKIAGRRLQPILEHRLVLEQKLGRYLRPEEVADHIDGLTLHNHPDNLRIFSENREHLRETLKGLTPKWSATGVRNQIGRHGLESKGYQSVDIYDQRKARGEIRLRQILLAALKLGIDSPYLLGTRRHLEKAQIDCSSRSTIERALADLYARWGWDQIQ